MCSMPFFASAVEGNKLLDRFSKNLQISNFKKIPRLETDLFHADRRTDITKHMFAFRKFTNAPKKRPMKEEKVAKNIYIYNSSHSSRVAEEAHRLYKPQRISKLPVETTPQHSDHIYVSRTSFRIYELQERKDSVF
jgi:hypothetical protein